MFFFGDIITKYGSINEFSKTFYAISDDRDKLYDQLGQQIYINAKIAAQKFKNVNKPFWNEELKMLWKDMHSKERVFRKFKSKHNRDRQNYYIDFKMARNLFDKKLRFYERRYNKGILTEIEEACVGNHKDFWQYVKNLGPKRKEKIPEEVYNENNDITFETDYVLNKWKLEFEKLYNNNEGVFDDNFKKEKVELKENWERSMLDPLYPENELINRNFTITEITKVVSKLKNKKAVGFDRIPNELLKNKNMITVLRDFFQICFDSSLVPDIWRQAMIKPIPKDRTKDQRIPLNYRGISLLSTISKLYTSVLNKRILNYEENANNFVDEQNGFRSDRNCADHIFSLTSIIRNRKNNGDSTYCVFVDYQKAFDFVDRDLLLYKIQLYGINGKIYNAISALYSGTSACILLNNLVTPWFNTTSGVRQGDSLSPTLFALYINDLIDEINALGKGILINGRRVSALVYADDLVIISESTEDLNVTLEKVNTWCKQWRILVNKEKTKAVHFRPKRVERTNDPVVLGNSHIDFVSEYKYLGIVLNEFLQYENTAEVLAKSATRALGSVMNKFKSLKNMGFETYCKLYESCVLPVLEYGSEIWGYKIFDSCEQVQSKALRYFYGVHKFAPKYALYGDSGWSPCVYNRRYNMVRFWNRLNKMDDSRLTKHIFNYDMQINKNNWSSEIHDIFQSYDLETHYRNREYCNLENLRRKIKENYALVWKQNVTNYPKLRTYLDFKETLEKEKYLTFDFSRRERSLLAQLRFGILPIRIETGRFVGETPDERLCIYCDKNVIEDEYHYIFYCDFYAEIRISTLGFRILTHDISPQDASKIIMKDKLRKLVLFLVLAGEKRSKATFE